MSPRETKAAFTIKSHPKVKSTDNFFPKKIKRGGPWGITDKFRGKLNISWLDIHLNHQACLLAKVLSDKEERAPVGDAFMRPYQLQIQERISFCSWGKGMRVWKTSGFKDKKI